MGEPWYRKTGTKVSILRRVSSSVKGGGKDREEYWVKGYQIGTAPDNRKPGASQAYISRTDCLNMGCRFELSEIRKGWDDSVTFEQVYGDKPIPIVTLTSEVKGDLSFIIEPISQKAEALGLIAPKKAEDMELMPKPKHVCIVDGCIKGCCYGGKMAFCLDHWGTIPVKLQDNCWLYYQRGQENTGMTTQKYQDAVKAAAESIRTAFGGAKPIPLDSDDRVPEVQVDLFSQLPVENAIAIPLPGESETVSPVWGLVLSAPAPVEMEKVEPIWGLPVIELTELDCVRPIWGGPASVHEVEKVAPVWGTPIASACQHIDTPIKKPKPQVSFSKWLGVSCPLELAKKPEEHGLRVGTKVKIKGSAPGLIGYIARFEYSLGDMIAMVDFSEQSFPLCPTHFGSLEIVDEPLNLYDPMTSTKVKRRIKRLYREWIYQAPTWVPTGYEAYNPNKKDPKALMFPAGSDPNNSRLGIQKVAPVW